MKRAEKECPSFVRKAFISHYFNIPFTLFIGEDYIRSTDGVDELFAAAQYLIRNFELAPYATDGLESKLLDDLANGRVRYTP